MTAQGKDITCARYLPPLHDPESVKRGYGRACFIKSGGTFPRKRRSSNLQGHDWEQMGLFDEEQEIVEI